MRRFLLPLEVLIMAALAAVSHAADPPKPHVLTVTQPILEAEDGLLLGNGDLSVSVYQSRDRLLFRFGKGDVWDRRIDYSDDPKPPTIKEIAHGIADEGWKCPPYGDSEPVALKGTDNPKRMKELCKGAPPNYIKRPYPCPKPVGELALQLPPDLPGLTVRQELTIEEGILRVVVSGNNGVELRLTCFVPPQTNVLAVRWELTGWTDTTRIANGPPLKFQLYRWADPPLLQFAQQFAAESGHGGFLGMDMDKSKPLPPPTARMVGDRRVIEQTFSADPTYPQGFRYFMAPFISEVGWENVDTLSVKEARIQAVAPEKAKTGWLVVAVPSTSGEGGIEAELGRVTAALGAKPADQVAKWETETRDEAARFWARSGVQIADPVLENLWYETYHARRCTTKAGKPPPGLFLPSTVRDYSHWHGDYHTNYNLQQPFWGDFTANQVEVGDAYFTAMGYFMQMGKIIAQKYYGTRGVFIQLSGYPIVATDDVLGAVPMGRMAYMTGWATTQYWERYTKTRDDKWLREVGYPAIRDCALFYLDFMTKGQDGLYHIFPSNQGEDGFTGDAKEYTDRAQVMRFARYALRAAIWSSEALSTDAELRAQWQDRLDHAAGDNGQPPYKLAGVVKYFYETNAPEFGDGQPYHTPPHEASPQPWPPITDGLNTWYSGQYPVAAMGNLRQGGLDPERAYLGMKYIIERWRHPNGIIWAMSVGNYGHAGAWTETLGVAAPLQEMMLQTNGGVLRIFPCWPKAVAASFRTFRAEGAFLVSASWADGAVTSVEILSEKGGPCRLYSPWDTKPKVETAAGKAVAVDGPKDDIYEFGTTAGERYRVGK